MKVTALVENRTIDPTLHAQHGLSLYIETKNHKILFDTGQDNAFILNAIKLGIDLSLVDIAVISHGHYDHGGGLEAFLDINSQAKIYLSKYAFEDHLKIKDGETKDIGIVQPKELDRLVFVDHDIMIDQEIMLICEISYAPSVIKDIHLFYEADGKTNQEKFHHELYMVIREKQQQVLFTGCSHKGIEHIVKVIEQTLSLPLNCVVGGFHFSHYDKTNAKETAYLMNLGKKFYQSLTTSFYACHCTGEEAFEVLKTQMGDKLADLKTGQEIYI